MTVLSKRQFPNLNIFNLNNRNTDYEWLGYGRVRNKKTGNIIDTNIAKKIGRLKTSENEDVSEGKFDGYRIFYGGDINWMFAY